MASNWKMQLRRALATSMVLGIALAPLASPVRADDDDDDRKTSVFRRGRDRDRDRDRNRDGNFRDRDRDGIDDRRDRDDDNDGVDDRYDTDFDPNRERNRDRPRDDYGNTFGRTSVTGVVVRDNNGDEFTLREDGTGREIRVRVQNEPRELSEGDRVQARGSYRRNGVLEATRVRVLSDRDDYRGDNNSNFRRTLTGIVNRDLGGDRFELRSDTGQTFVVRLQDGESSRVSRGDRVRVSGRYRYENNRPVFVAERFDILRNNDRDDNFDRRTVLTGVITREQSGDRFDLRLNNGRIVRVVPDGGVNLSNHSVGDVVRIEGYVRDDRFVARSLRVVDGDNGNDYNGQTVDFRGTIVRVRDDNRLVVRGDNGRDYEVRLNNTRDFDRGDRVRVRGFLRDGVTRATRIDRV